MGLDQYAYVRCFNKDGQSANVQIAQWRKHPNLQGFMCRRWLQENPTKTADHFNCESYTLKPEDLEALRKANGDDPELADLTEGHGTTQGFFFGAPCDTEFNDWWSVFEFIRAAENYNTLGLEIVYTSDW